MSNNPTKILIVVLGLIAGLFFAVELASNTRSVSGLSKFLAAGTFVFCVARPRVGYLLVFALGGYLELLKIVAWIQSGRYIDLVALNLPPLLGVMGLSCGAFLLILTGKIRVTRFLVIVWMAAILLGGYVGAKALFGGANSSGLGDAANRSVYLMLVPVTATLFQTSRVLIELFKNITILLIPAALYGIYQGIAGFPEFHMIFKETFRPERRLDSGAFVQPSGTMNSAISFGTSMAICALMIVTINVIRRKSSVLSWLAFTIFMLAAIASGRRSAMLIIPIFLFARFCFRSPLRTILLYSGATSLILSFYLFAQPLMKTSARLNKDMMSWADSTFGSSTLATRLANVGTFSDRFLGFYNMTRNTDLWTPFGLPDEKLGGKFGFGRGEGAGALAQQGDFDAMRDDFVHDGLNKSIMKYGYVPMGCILLLGGIVLFRCHLRSYRIADKKLRELVILSFALLLSIGLLILSSQQALFVFPANLFSLTMLGGMLASFFMTQDENEIEQQELQVQEQ